VTAMQTLSIANGLVVITNDSAELAHKIRFVDRSLRFVHIICELLFVSQELQMWLWCRALKLYMKHLTYMQNFYLINFSQKLNKQQQQ
jgi:hypothetical protein